MGIKSDYLAEPPFIGRGLELSTLSSCLTAVLEGKGTTIFVSGEAGSGKTRLAREFLNLARDRDIALLSGWCLSDGAYPYFPFIEAFKACFRGRVKSENEPQDGVKSGFIGSFGESEEAKLREWLLDPGKSRKNQELTPEAMKDLTFQAVSDALRAISTQKPTILFLEDIHWADSASLALLHYVAWTLSSERVLFLATFRSDELATDSEGRAHPLVTLVQSMKREDFFQEIKLPVLSRDSVSDIAEKMLGESLDAELLGKLNERSRGNPLFVVESLRLWSERKSLVKDKGVLRLSADEFVLPSKFKDIILRRLGLLKFSQRRVLDVASVIGEKFDLELLGSALGLQNLEVLEILDEVAQSTSLVCFEGNSYKFDHARSREILYEEISAPLKRGYHAKVAQILESASQDGTTLLNSSLAYHFAQAGNREKAVRYSLSSGEEALARFSNSEAIKHFTYLLDIAQDSPECSTQREKALSGLGHALSRNGLHRESMRTFESLFEIAESGSTKLHALRMLMYLSIWWGGGAKQTLELAAKAKELAGFDGLEYARVRLMKAKAEGQRGMIQEALRETIEVLKIFEEKGSLWDLASALLQMATYHARVDKNPFENALPTALRAVSFQREFGDLHLLSEGLLPLSNIFMSCGLFENSLETFEELIKLQEKIGEHNHALPYFYQGAMFETKGMLDIMSGGTGHAQDFETAISLSLKGVQVVEKSEAYYGPLLVYGNLVRLYLKLGDMANAEKFYEKLKNLFQDRIESADPWLFAQCFRSKAVFLAAKGQWAESNEHFEKSLAAFERMRSLVFPMFKAEAIIDYAESLTKQQRIKESKTQLEKADKIIQEFRSLRNQPEGVKITATLLSKQEVGVGEEFDLRLDLVNISKDTATLVRVENIIPVTFKITSSPTYHALRNGSLMLDSKKFEPFSVEPIKIRLQATKVGTYTLEPKVILTDTSGATRTCQPPPIVFTVRPSLHAKIGETTFSVPILPGRIATGFVDLDVLLYGGIPENYAVILTSAPHNERDLLTKNFVEKGIEMNELVFCVSADAEIVKSFIQKAEPDLYLLICNPKADSMFNDFPNVFKVNGVENLNEIDISLVKAFRGIDPAYRDHKRAYIGILSDVLLQHHAVITRKWLSSILADLKSKGFTALAVLDPSMHSREDAQAILSLFEGEIRISERETDGETEKILRVRKLYNQQYLENDLVLDKKERKIDSDQ